MTENQTFPAATRLAPLVLKLQIIAAYAPEQMRAIEIVIKDAYVYADYLRTRRSVS